jgi:hypothetical protein
VLTAFESFIEIGRAKTIRRARNMFFQKAMSEAIMMIALTLVLAESYVHKRMESRHLSLLSRTVM